MRGPPTGLTDAWLRGARLGLRRRPGTRGPARGFVFARALMTRLKPALGHVGEAERGGAGGTRGHAPQRPGQLHFLLLIRGGDNDWVLLTVRSPGRRDRAPRPDG